MSKTTLVNKSDKVVRFEIGQPGQPPLKYEVAPGETCELPHPPGSGSFGKRLKRAGLVECDAQEAPKPSPPPAPPAEEMELPPPAPAKRKRGRPRKRPMDD